MKTHPQLLAVALFCALFILISPTSVEGAVTINLSVSVGPASGSPSDATYGFFRYLSLSGQGSGSNPGQPYDFTPLAVTGAGLTLPAGANTVTPDIPSWMGSTTLPTENFENEFGTIPQWFIEVNGNGAKVALDRTTFILNGTDGMGSLRIDHLAAYAFPWIFAIDNGNVTFPGASDPVDRFFIAGIALQPWTTPTAGGSFNAITGQSVIDSFIGSALGPDGTASQTMTVIYTTSVDVVATGTVTFVAGAVPEPSTYALIVGLVTLGMVTLLRRRNKSLS